MKDKDVDEAHGKSEGVYSKGGLLRVEKNALCNFHKCHRSSSLLTQLLNYKSVQSCRGEFPLVVL